MTKRKMILKKRFHKDLHHMVSHHLQVKKMIRKMANQRLAMLLLCLPHHLSLEVKSNGWKISIISIAGVITRQWLLSLEFHTIHHSFSLMNRDQLHLGLLSVKLRESQDQHYHAQWHLSVVKNNGKKMAITLMIGEMLKWLKQTWEFLISPHLFK